MFTRRIKKNVCLTLCVCVLNQTDLYRHPEIMIREGEAGAAQNRFIDSTESNSSVASTADFWKNLKKKLGRWRHRRRFTRLTTCLVVSNTFFGYDAPCVYGNVVSKEKPMASRLPMDGSLT